MLRLLKAQLLPYSAGSHLLTLTWGKHDSRSGAQAEHFDNKVRSLGSPLLTLILSNRLLHLTDIIFVLFASDMALYDANSEVWGQKVSPLIEQHKVLRSS